MNKYLLIAASAMFVLASCTNDEDQSEPQEINFSAFNYKPTRAPITGTTYGTGAPDFGVFAAIVATTNATSTQTYAANYATSELYMDDIKIKYDGGDYKIWRPVNGSDAFVKYYWPLTGKLTFVGYTPYSVNADFDEKNRTFTITDYSADAENIANQADVMYSKISNASDKTANSTQYTAGGGTNTGVNILFNHALSQIVFRAKTDRKYDDAAFTIDYITVQNVLNTGSLSVVNDIVSNVSTVVDGWTTSGTGQNFTPVSGKLLTEKIASYGDSLLLIPQSFSDNVKIEIKYTMDPAFGPNSSKVVNIELNDADKINLNQIRAGKKYFIDLTVAANEILFAPSIVADWESQTSNTYNP